MEERLKELSFENVSMDVSVKDDEDALSASGIDDVDILVSFNLGEPVKSLSQVASGGELSRFMLALKEVTADKEKVGTLVFDEIDSGISGKTAWNVSGSMKNLASSHQVIAITHLPQIAARADAHYLIEKYTEADSTVTDIKALSEDEKEKEIARLLSGGELTEAGLANARELLSKA
jgi:DNA repair protein RecN (Recombination protein N)